jgi:hypothetical protein
VNPGGLCPVDNRVDIVKSLGEMGLGSKVLVPTLRGLIRGEERRAAVVAADVLKNIDPEADRAGKP